MIETEMQKLVVDAVIAGGGRAMKMSNEFVKGVSDLLIKLPGKPAFFLEAKRKDVSRKTIDNVSAHDINEFWWDWDITVLQKNFLRDWHAANMPCGVLSFVQETGGNINTLRMRAYDYISCVALDWRPSLSSHVELGKSDVRYERIYNHLVKFAKDF